MQKVRNPTYKLKRVNEYVAEVRQETESRYGLKLNFKFGTMIETVRACTRSGQLAEVAEFFSFGTNDLTQATFSFSREDAENKFLPLYNEVGLLEDNPFEVLDVNELCFGLFGNSRESQVTDFHANCS